MKLSNSIKNIFQLITLFVAGLSLTLAFAPFEYYLFSVVSPAIFIAILLGLTKVTFSIKSLVVLEKNRNNLSNRMKFFQCWIYGFGVFLGGVHWIYVSIADHGGGGPIAGIVVVPLFAAFMALYVAIAGYLSLKMASGNRSRLLICFPALWCLFEILRGFLFTGFPWLTLGNSHVETILSSFAPIGGSYFISFILIYISGACVLFFSLSAVRERITLLFSIILIFTVANNLDKTNWTDAVDDNLNVSVVQGNIGQDIKWLYEYRQFTLNLYYDLSERLWTDSDVIVWPETAVPAFLSDVSGFVKTLDERAEREGKTIVFGIAHNKGDGQYYNSVMSMGNEDGEYLKQHLVLFGEYLPFRRYIGDVLDFMGAPMADFSVGGESQSPLPSGKYKAGASVCFEIVFPLLINRSAIDSNYLINISNDGWFGDSIGPHQHLQIAKMRALETNRPIIRSTNTGISAIIDADGTIIKQSQQFEQQVLTAKITPRTGLTPYVKYGNKPIIILILVLIAICLVLRIIAKRKNDG